MSPLSRPILLNSHDNFARSADLLDMTEAAVSHQFRILRMNGLVERRRKGKEICYRLNDSHVNRIMEQGCEHLYERSKP